MNAFISSIEECFSKRLEAPLCDSAATRPFCDHVSAAIDRLLIGDSIVSYNLQNLGNLLHALPCCLLFIGPLLHRDAGSGEIRILDLVRYDVVVSFLSVDEADTIFQEFTRLEAVPVRGSDAVAIAFPWIISGVSGVNRLLSITIHV